jgi:hypothetical protein
MNMNRRRLLQAIAAIAAMPAVSRLAGAATVHSIADGQWHRVTLTRTSGELATYVNGMRLAPGVSLFPTVFAVPTDRFVAAATPPPLQMHGVNIQADGSNFEGDFTMEAHVRVDPVASGMQADEIRITDGIARAQESWMADLSARATAPDYDGSR